MCQFSFLIYLLLCFCSAVEEKEVLWWHKRAEIMEISKNNFYIATQFHPEFTSRPGKPDPIYYNFVKSSLGKN